MEIAIKACSWLIVILFMLISNISLIITQEAQNLLPIDTETFRLLSKQQCYYLQYDKDKFIRIPYDWLVPSDEADEDADAYISSFNYNEEVTAFPIGEDWIGLHISSYEIQREGSAQAAAGRDIFLIFNSKENTLHHAGITLGITKERNRFMGCFFAKFHNFIIMDINNDKLIDIGIIKEEITWEKVYDEENEVEFMLGPFYEKQPARWYIFVKNYWEYTPNYDGKYPLTGYLELPLIGLEQSPVDFVKEVYKGKLKNKPAKHY
jgi:hypothetical protein